MNLRFAYELVNADHLTNEQRAEIERALEARAYVCQQEFEKALDLYHEINVIAEADDEARVSRITIESDEVAVELDCSKVRL